MERRAVSRNGLSDEDFRRARVSQQLPEFIECPHCKNRIRVWQWGPWGKALCEQRSLAHDVQIITTLGEGHRDAFVIHCGRRTA